MVGDVAETFQFRSTLTHADVSYCYNLSFKLHWLKCCGVYFLDPTSIGVKMKPTGNRPVSVNSEPSEYMNTFVDDSSGTTTV